VVCGRGWAAFGAVASYMVDDPSTRWYGEGSSGADVGPPLLPSLLSRHALAVCARRGPVPGNTSPLTPICPMTTSSSPVQLHELHPVEQFLALLLISAAALHRLFSEPPRVIRQKPAPYSAAAIALAAEAAFGRAPLYGFSILDPVLQTMFEIAPLSSHTIRELQQMARERGIRSVDGRPLKYCKKARLVEVLSNG
jgi:hypothetical protein